MTLTIPESLLNEIAEHCKRMYPLETCGLLIGKLEGMDSRVTKVYPAENVHEEDHARRYLIRPSDHLAAEKEARGAGASIIGYFHSHPDHPAAPSEYDREQAWPFAVYVIVSVCDGNARETRAWELDEETRKFEPVTIEIANEVS